MRRGDFDLKGVIRKRAAEHYKLRGPFTVPEWEQDGVTFEYYYRPSNQEEVAKTREFMQDAGKKGVAAFLCMKMLDEDGNPWLSLPEAITLAKEGEFDVMDRIASEIIAEQNEIEKSSNEDLGNS